MIFCVGVTFWGLSQMEWSKVHPFISISMFDYISFLVLGAVVVEGIVKWLKVGRLIAGIMTIFLISILTGTIWSLLVGLWFFSASYVLGLTILSALKIGKANLSGASVFLIGAGVYGTVIGLLAHFPVNYPGVYGVILGLPVMLGWRSLLKAAQMLHEFRFQPAKFKWLDLSIALIVFVHFSVALMPELGHDALAMHLSIPSHLFTRHEWGFDVNTYVWAVMPTMGDWIYSITYMLGGETAARIINVGFILTLSWLLRELVLWAGGNALGTRWAVLIFLVTPLTFRETSSLFIESIWASFIVAGTISIFQVISSRNSSEKNLPIAGLFLGGALATKAVTFTFIPGLLLLMVMRYRVWVRKNLISTILMSLTLFLAIGAVPYITAWYFTGNPVFPFFNEYFQAPQYPAMNFSAPAIFEKGVSWDTVYRMTFESGKYLESKPGAAGFQWLLLLLPVIVYFLTTRNLKGLALITVGIFAVVLTFHQTAYLRYILPSYAILGAAIGLALSETNSDRNDLLHKIFLVLSTVTIALNILFFNSGTYFGNIALKPLTSKVGRIEYLQHRLPIRNAVSLVNSLNAGNSPVAVFAQPLTAGLLSDALYPSWYNHKFRSLIQGANNANSIADVLQSKGVAYIILDNNWSSEKKRLIIKEATKEVSVLGSISVRVLKEEYRFNTELLKDTNFVSDKPWHYSRGVKKIESGIIVSRSLPATQIVSVTAGRRYLLSVESTCLNSPSKGRLQVNWLNIKSKIINTNIKVFDCVKFKSLNSMEVTPPSDAVKAVIYAAGHTDELLIFNKVSFRK